ncbi:uncharacterized protein BP5553_10428 [Venustampulla echinocandica]|uniref:Uncharacterized protein n=1 Tax=Venustampulla echinocandica TaxID=2656787 RepID=A0A370T9A3_9HELO|nr:uncharacterized protein BP5553_10428 [Venustampulla echinocandica]RDL30150.1 hypothetical protein BP5553_10428 [Venustampulla echinocandica]
MRGLSVEDASVAAAKSNGISASTRCDLIKSSAKRPNPPMTSSFKYNDSECICKLFIVYDSDQNPFRGLISLALGDSTLLKAILALAARHNANRRYLFRQPLLATLPASSNSDEDALLYKCQAIQGLSLALNDGAPRRQDTIAARLKHSEQHLYALGYYPSPFR